MNEKYILYARKSTDTEDKQVLSIEAQIVELRKYARDNGLIVIDELIEKKTAKEPGRPIFNSMLVRVQSGEANGILAWHPDRLARNSIDGGQIIYLLDQTTLNYLRFPMFQFENTSQGKFMLSIMFGQSKYYVDNLAENVKRGLRQKVRRGDFPGLAPLGYYNHPKTKTLSIEKSTAPLAKQVFELYAKDKSRFQDIAAFLFVKGIKTKGGKPYPKDKIKLILTNPVYYGHFRYGGEVHAGNHEPLITKKLFDEVQAILQRRCHVQKPKNESLPLCGIVHCSCGMMITAERQVKRYKNGTSCEYVYYHCTRKSKTVRCKEPALRSELFDEQLSSLALDYAMPKAWASQLLAWLERDEAESVGASERLAGDLRVQIAHLSEKLERLLDSFLEQDIERVDYLTKKAEIMSEKKTLEEKMGSILLGQNTWLEPMKKWIETAVSIWEITKSDDLTAKKSLYLEIFGLNLKMENKKVSLSTEQFQTSPQKNSWVLLCKTAISQTKTGATRLNLSKNSFLVAPPRLELGTQGSSGLCSTN